MNGLNSRLAERYALGEFIDSVGEDTVLALMESPSDPDEMDLQTRIKNDLCHFHSDIKTLFDNPDYLAYRIRLMAIK